jgi:hypothetical protein
MGDQSGLFREELDRYRLCERVKGTRRTGATARVVRRRCLCQASAGSGKDDRADRQHHNHVLEPQVVGVIIKATRHPMTTRGVHKPDTNLVTSRMLGCFRDNALTPQEFLGMAT